MILDLIRLLFLYGFSFNDDLDPPVMADFWWISILLNDIRWPLVSLYISRKTINLFRTWGYLRCPYGCSCNCYIRWSLDSVFIWENYYYIDLGQTVTSGLLLDISLKVNPGHLTVADFLWISIFKKKKTQKNKPLDDHWCPVWLTNILL